MCCFVYLDDFKCVAFALVVLEVAAVNVFSFVVFSFFFTQIISEPTGDYEHLPLKY